MPYSTHSLRDCTLSVAKTTNTETLLRLLRQEPGEAEVLRRDDLAEPGSLFLNMLNGSTRMRVQSLQLTCANVT